MPGISIDKRYEKAKVEKDTRLYRLVKSAYSDLPNLLNGQGGYYAQGRYNYKHQPTSYCSDNVFLCISEILFHMYDVSLRKLKNNDFSGFRAESSKRFELVVFNSKTISNLIYIDSKIGRQNYNINSSTLTHSDTIYSGLQDVSHRVRLNSKEGFVTPSARHSKGFAVVLFGDHSKSIDHIEHKFSVKLSLLKEDLSMPVNDKSFDPVEDKISQNIGHFQFSVNDFRRNTIFLKPLPSSNKGRINYSRTYYSSNYPDSAIV